MNMYVGIPNILEDSPIPRKFIKVITPTQKSEIIIFYGSKTGYTANIAAVEEETLTATVII